MSSRPEPAAELVAIEPDGNGLRVRFYLDGDRYRHVVELVNAEGATPVLESVEGGCETHWPPSPPFQNLYIHERGDMAPVVDLTGATGRGHWSGAVTVGYESFPDQGSGEYQSEHIPRDSRQQIMYSIACRYRTAPKWLGSSYQPIDNARIGITPSYAYAGNDRDAIIIGPRRDLLLPQSEPLECVVNEYRDRSGAAMLEVRPPSGELQPSPATIVWEYRMILATV